MDPLTGHDLLYGHMEFSLQRLEVNEQDIAQFLFTDACLEILYVITI